MSQANIEALTLIAVVTGAVQGIAEAEAGGVAAPTLVYASDTWKHVINKWPMSGNWQKQSARIGKNCRKINKHLNGALDKHGSFVLCALSQELLIELRDRLRSREKIRIVDEILECINTAVDLYDPKEVNDHVREEASRLSALIIKEVMV